MASTFPAISVIIAHFGADEDARTLLKETIASVRAQDYPGTVEVAVADDGSPWSAALRTRGSQPVTCRDRSHPLLKDLDPDLLVTGGVPEVFGKSRMLNATLAATTGPLVVLLDDDHPFLGHRALSAYARYLARYAFVMGRIINGDGSIRSPLHGMVQGSNLGVRRSLLKEAGGFEERCAQWGCGDDPALFWRIYQVIGTATPKQAVFAGDILTRDRRTGRWHGMADDARFVEGFREAYGVNPHHNPCRDFSQWMDYGRCSSPAIEYGVRLHNRLRRAIAPKASVLARALGLPPHPGPWSRP